MDLSEIADRFEVDLMTLLIAVALPLLPVVVALLLRPLRRRSAAASQSPEPVSASVPESDPEPAPAPAPEPERVVPAAPLPTPGAALYDAERQAQLCLQAAMAEAVAGRAAVVTVSEHVPRHYNPHDDDPPRQSSGRPPAVAATAASEEVIRNVERFFGRGAPSRTSFGHALEGCKDTKLVLVYRWFCVHLSEGERQDLYKAGGMKACDDACVAMAEHVLGYDRPWWKRLLGLGMPNKDTLPPGLRRLV